MAESLLSLAPGVDSWSLAAVQSDDGVSFALKLGVMRGAEASTLTIATSREDARALAFEILASVGDATQRTFAPGLLKSPARATAAPVPSDPAIERAATPAQGFTGDICAHCFAAMMLRTGHCLTCQNCGANTGCS